MSTVQLSNCDRVVEVSEEDYLTLILLGPWCLSGGYAMSTTSKGLYLHRVVANRMGLASDKEVDHIDRNKFNSKRNNLRAVTRSEQMLNCGIPSTNTSGYKNINFNKKASKWEVRIPHRGKRVYLGRFTTIEEAIQKRNDYVRKHNLKLIE